MPPPGATTFGGDVARRLATGVFFKNPEYDLGLVWIDLALARLAAATVAVGQAAGDQSVADAAIEGALHRDAQVLDELRVDDAPHADMNFGDFAVVSMIVMSLNLSRLWIAGMSAWSRDRRERDSTMTASKLRFFAACISASRPSRSNMLSPETLRSIKTSATL